MADGVPDLTPEQWTEALARRHDAELDELRRLNAYYEGRQPLSYLHPELIAELEGRLRQVVINWPRLVVDSVEERLDVEGFRYGGDADADQELWQLWQANDLDEQSQQGHLDALVMRRAYVTVGSNETEPDTPLVTVESPLQVCADFDPRTRRVRAALKRWKDDPYLRGTPTPPGSLDLRDATGQMYAALYLPEATHWYEWRGGWRESDRDDHGLGTVPVVPLVNRPRLLAPSGASELADVLPLSDAANKVATDMMVSAEYHAMPRRWVFGMSRDDFIGADGKPLSTWSALAGRIWATDNTDAKAGQFPEADLSNYHATLGQLAQLVAAISGLPPHYLGFTTDNPASADAIRSSEARLVKRAERKQRAWGGAWEHVMRLALQLRDGEADPRARSLETLWRDASTPTIAQKADAAAKLHAEGITTLRQAREDLGYTQGQIQRMEVEDESAIQRIVSGDAAAVLSGPKPEATQPTTAAAPPPPDEAGR